VDNSTPYRGLLRLPDAFVVEPAERLAEKFCLKLSMIFDPCPWGKLSIRLSVLGLRVWLWRVELCCVTEDLGIWGIACGIRLGLFCSAGRASHQLTRSCSAVFSASNSAMRSFSCCNPPPGWLRHKTCDILGLSLQLCFHALFYLLEAR